MEKPAMPIEQAARAYESVELGRRPGFLIRRLHQMHLAFFAEECAGFDTTPLQSSVLTVALRQPGLEQSRLAEAVGVDRATLAEVVARLEERGLLRRTSHRSDRRLKLVRLTPQGKRLLERLAGATSRAHARVLAPLGAEEQAKFLETLSRLVEVNAELCRPGKQVCSFLKKRTKKLSC
jgi:DNA-binding MarR family transcriptional regulator